MNVNRLGFFTVLEDSSNVDAERVNAICREMNVEVIVGIHAFRSGSLVCCLLFLSFFLSF